MTPKCRNFTVFNNVVHGVGNTVKKQADKILLSRTYTVLNVVWGVLSPMQAGSVYGY